MGASLPRDFYNIMADLVTLQQYKDFAGLQGVQNDARLNVIIDNVSQLVKTYCGTTIIDFANSDKTEYFNLADDYVDRIILSESPLISVSSVQEREGVKAVKVVYRAGYTSTPEDLKLAVFDLIKYYMKEERKERMSIAGASVDNPLSTSLRNNIGFPDHIKRVLDMYKIYS